MKKIIKHAIATVLISVFIFACARENNIESNTTISLEVEGVTDGEMARLFAFSNKKELQIDSALFKDGKVTLKTDTTSLTIYYVFVNKEEAPIVLFLDDKCSDVKIKTKAPLIADKYTVENSEYSNDFLDYQNFSYIYNKEKNVAYNEIVSFSKLVEKDNVDDSLKFVSLVNVMDSLFAITQDYALNYINEKPESPVSWMMLREFNPNTGLEAFNLETFDYYEKVANAIRAKYPNSEYPEMIEEDSKNLKSQINSMMAEVESMKNGGGDSQSSQAAPEISLTNPEGKTISLSSLRGNVVLIDFWASWCGPCRKENPNVVANYNKYKSKGFTVYSVSLDTDIEKWKQAIKADGLTWGNHVSDLQGWNSPAAATYGVTSIPASFLIDENGNLIGTNLRGEQLGSTLAGIYK